ncbi:MAG: hypothetical protein KF778_21400 [Rhodocyclaceae bacterium]|nr:hypothetical protein [Rhodocyclaceae bacterium]
MAGIAGAGVFRPNRRIRALMAQALLSGSDYGRGFGSVFHHHYSTYFPQLAASKLRQTEHCRGFLENWEGHPMCMTNEIDGKVTDFGQAK